MKERFFEIEEELYYLCKMMPIKAVSEMYQLDWHTVKRLDKCYLLKEEFREFYLTDFSYLKDQAEIIQWAYNYLSGWCERVKESGLKNLKIFQGIIQNIYFFLKQ